MPSGVRTRTSGIMIPAFVTPAAATYTGPGDVVAGAMAWWGLRAYTNSAIGTNAIRLRGADTTESNFITVSGGGLDMTSIDAFIVAHGACTFVTLFDQTGNGRDLTQAVAASQPSFVTGVLGGKAICRVASGTNTFLTAVAVVRPQPLTLTILASRTANFTSNTFILGDTNCALGYRNAANQLDCFAGTDVFAAATDSTFHAIQFVANGASGDINVDGTANPVNAGAAGVSAVALNGIFSTFLDGDVAEAGLWNTPFTGTQSSNMSSNQHAYWGF